MHGKYWLEEVEDKKKWNKIHGSDDNNQLVNERRGWRQTNIGCRVKNYQCEYNHCDSMSRSIELPVKTRHTANCDRRSIACESQYPPLLQPLSSSPHILRFKVKVCWMKRRERRKKSHTTQILSFKSIVTVAAYNWSSVSLSRNQRRKCASPSESSKWQQYSIWMWRRLCKRSECV